MLALGLFADALFGLIAVVNSAIGIRQELKAKETLDQLALLVAPRASAIRDGRPVELRADQVVPGDVVGVEPGDQLVADGVVVASRGLTMDESVLTGESDGIRKHEGDRVLSGSFCLVGSGYYEVDAVREQSYAEQVAGEARAFRHPPSPLQLEVNQVLRATTIVMVPLGVLLLLAFSIRSVDLHEAAQTATAGLVTLIPEGLVLLMSVTLAVAAVRLARHEHPGAADGGDRVAGRGGHGLRRQDRDAHRRDPRPGRGRGRRPGPPAAAERGARPLRALGGSAKPDPRDDRRALSRGRRSGWSPRCRSRRRWKWSGADARRRRLRPSYVLGAPDVLSQAGALELPPRLERSLEQHTAAGRRVVAFGESVGAPARRPGRPAAAEARAARPGRPRGAASPRRRRDDRVPARARRST